MRAWAGRPAQVIGGLGFEARDGWPRGVYRATAAALPLELVVVRELPRERDTLMLRLMGAGRTLRDALDDLARLPADVWERRAATGAVQLLHAYAADAAAPRSPHEKDIIMTVSQLYEQIKDEGRQEGRREFLLRLLKRRFGELSGRVVERIQAADEAQVDAWGEVLVDARSLDDIFGEPSTSR